MTSLEKLAISKVVKKAALTAAREAIDPGQNQAVDVTVRIVGTMNVGDDYEYTPTASIPMLDALALAIHDAGITGQAAVNALMRGMTRALENGDDAKGILGGMRANLDEAERKIRAGLAALPKATAKGKVTTKLEVAELVVA